MYRKFQKDEPVSTEIIAGKKYTPKELDEIASQILRDDSKAERCRECGASGEPTGESASVTEGIADKEGHELALKFEEYRCENGHIWYPGEGKPRGIDGENPILFREHFDSRKRREIYTSIGTPDPSIVQGIYNRCVDSMTLALTPNGWKGFEDLEIGMLIWGYDPETRSGFWQSLEEIFVNPEFAGELQVLESQNLSARVTEGHKWAAVHERDKAHVHVVHSTLNEIPSRLLTDHVTGQFTAYEEDYEYLTSRHYIPLAAPPSNPNIDPTGREHLFELLGWILTDGTYRGENKNDAIVYQAMHNPKVTALRECLRKNDLSDIPMYVDDNNVGRWSIPVRVGKPLRALSNNQKKISSVPLDQYAFSEYEALLQGIVAGDGSIRETPAGYTSREIYSTKETEALAIQALCARLGIPSRIRTIENPEAFCPIEYAVNLKKSVWGYVRPALQDPEEYEGVVWCPRIASGFWLAQRNGRVYVTGNTHPSGRKVNSLAQRKKKWCELLQIVFTYSLNLYNNLTDETKINRRSSARSYGSCRGGSIRYCNS